MRPRKTRSSASSVTHPTQQLVPSLLGCSKILAPKWVLKRDDHVLGQRVPRVPNQAPVRASIDGQVSWQLEMLTEKLPEARLSENPRVVIPVDHVNARAGWGKPL